MYNHPNYSKIIELELEITSAIINGHRPSADDEYEEKRKELERLRKEIEGETEDKTFKQKSKWTKRNNSQIIK